MNTEGNLASINVCCIQGRWFCYEHAHTLRMCVLLTLQLPHRLTFPRAKKRFSFACICSKKFSPTRIAYIIERPNWPLW